MRTRQTITHLPIDQVVPSGSPIRDRLGNLDELVATIREHGILTPLLVTESPEEPGRYTLLSGRRRFAAALVAGASSVPVVIRHGLGDDPVEQLLVILAEDAGAPLGHESRGHVVAALLSRGLTIPDVVRRTGLDGSAVAWLLSLLDVEDLAVLDSPDAADALRLSDAARAPGAESTWFNRAHPAADAASRRCRHRREKRIGGVACGPCWERGIVAMSAGTETTTLMVDESAVRRAVAGDPAAVLNPAEKVEAVRILTAQQHSARDIAARLQVSVKTVYRARAALPATG